MWYNSDRPGNSRRFLFANIEPLFSVNRLFPGQELAKRGMAALWLGTTMRKLRTSYETRHLPGFVYVLKSSVNDLYKIGMAQDVAKRLHEINFASPVEVLLIHTIFSECMPWAEANLHHKYIKQRHHGEWFQLQVWNIHKPC